MEYLEAKSLGLQTNLTATQEERAAALLEEIQRIESQGVGRRGFRTSIEGLSESLDAHKVASDESRVGPLAVRGVRRGDATYLEKPSLSGMSSSRKSGRGPQRLQRSMPRPRREDHGGGDVRAQAEAVRDEAAGTPVGRRRPVRGDLNLDRGQQNHRGRGRNCHDAWRASAVEAAAAADKAAAADALQAHEATVVERFSAVDGRIASGAASRQADAQAAKEALDQQLADLEAERVKGMKPSPRLRPRKKPSAPS